MNNYSSALYNENRNAIPSWQGYVYQGEVALNIYLKIINEICCNTLKDQKSIESECQSVKIRIEWLEDFVVIKNEKITDIYQVKKTLNRTNMEEVISNFILQYAFLRNEDITWHIVYSDTEVDVNKLTKSEFISIYQENVEKNFMNGIQKLLDNRNPSYWNTNLNLRSKTEIENICKGYLRKLFDLEEIDYKSAEGIQKICDELLGEILQKCGEAKRAHVDFINKLEYEKILHTEVLNASKEYVNKFPGFIKVNKVLTDTDIIEKIQSDLHRKLAEIGKPKLKKQTKCKTELQNLIYEFKDIKSACKSEKNEKNRWELLLEHEREKILNNYVKKKCENCPKKDKTEICENCIYSKVKSWDMCELIDNINLEYPNFSVETAEISFKNKASDIKMEALEDIIEKYSEKCLMKDNKNIECVSGEEKYYISNVYERKNTQTELWNNYWEHIAIYKDYETILTCNVDCELDENGISIIKEKGNYEDEEIKEKIDFFDTRRTKFIGYKGATI